ncbi:MAG: 1-deoxy-D-xylulose-5-phosphate reductoisomerase [Deltaproteobacteria bacterium]|jgi:1-deoxy-D-xylulose-5-phosphate reductoisomerase|nr:1-deoxy-D-xylulose-5-phosphate reductoisomerase [Deltaproteobacteria bacterium]
MPSPLTIAVLGSTGSVGRSTLSLAAAFPEKIKVVALAARGGDPALLESQIRRFRPEAAALSDPGALDTLRRNLAGLKRPPEMLAGEEGVVRLASRADAEVVVSAVVGAAGLRPTWAALKAGRRVALANKESLVLAGEILMKLAAGRLAPVDSEHSAIFQALDGRLNHPDLCRIILTASGGPFLGRTRGELRHVTPAEALRHPVWSMGPKISIDSATMMNKGLEVIEARHLFGLGYDRIEVVVHPAGLVHSLAGFKDGSLLAQLGPADMRLAIAYALSHPRRWRLLAAGEGDRLAAVAALGGPGDEGGGGGPGAPGPPGPDFSNFLPTALPGSLTFRPPDEETFGCLRLAREAGRTGGTAPAILNGANETAVEAFLAGKLSFLGIAEVVEKTLDKMEVRELGSVDDALEADAEARRIALGLVGGVKN